MCLPFGGDKKKKKKKLPSVVLASLRVRIVLKIPVLWFDMFSITGRKESANLLLLSQEFCSVAFQS